MMMMDRLGGDAQQYIARTTPTQLLGLYAEQPHPELRKEILVKWWADREEFARHIEEAVMQMAKEPRGGLVSTDGQMIGQWNDAFARYPQLWTELEREVRQITNATRTRVDREQYSRAVLAITSRCCSLHALQECSKSSRRRTTNLS